MPKMQELKLTRNYLPVSIYTFGNGSPQRRRERLAEIFYCFPFSQNLSSLCVLSGSAVNYCVFCLRSSISSYRDSYCFIMVSREKCLLTNSKPFSANLL